MKIDNEFRALIPPLSADEYAQLEANIIADGCRDPLVVWDGTLIDGHNRHKICTEHGIPYATKEHAFADRDAAIIWIIENQFGRRNLSDISRMRLALALKDAVARQAKAQQIRKPISVYPISDKQNPIHTLSEIAKVAGVGHDKLHKFEKIESEAAAGNVDKKTMAALEAHETTVNAVYTNIKREKAQAENRARAEEAAKIAPLRATVRNCDALEFIRELPDHSVDLLFTDPPYSTDVDDISGFAHWLRWTTPKIKPTGRAYVCIGAYPQEMLAYLEVLRQARWLDKSQLLVWTYRNTLGPSPATAYKNNWQAIIYLCGKDAPPLDCPVMLEQFSVQDINAPDGRQGDRYHAWQKPDELAERFIRHSTKPGDLVVDPFAGTGTFLLAAARLGRRGIGCDNNPASLNIAEQRGCIVE